MPRKVIAAALQPRPPQSYLQLAPAYHHALNTTRIAQLRARTDGAVRRLAGGRALCVAVASNSRLSYLNLSYNAIPSTGQQELREVWTKAHGGSQLGLHL